MSDRKRTKSETRATVPTPIRDEDLGAVAGGRKAGGTQMEFLKLTLNDALISSVS
jgi:hypothetical protein